MKKKIVMVLMVTLLSGMLAACGKDASELVYLKDFKPEKYCTLGEYKGVEISLEDPQVTEEYLNQYIDYLLQSSPELVPVTDRTTVETGDTVIIDYEGKVDDVAFEGGTAQDANLTIGSGQFIPGFEDGVIGMETGATKDVEVTFPDPYDNNPDLAGKAAVFTVTVKSINTQEIPELTDEYVAGLELEECKTAQEYRDFVEKVLTESAQEEYAAQKQQLIVDAVVKNATFKEAPSGMVDRMNDTLTKNLTSYANAYGVDIAQYVAQMYGGTAEDYEATLKEQSSLMADRYIMIAAIAQQEGLTVSDEELEAQVAEDATNYGYATTEEYKAAIDLEAYREYLLTQKVTDLLAESAVVNGAAEEPAAEESAAEEPAAE